MNDNFSYRQAELSEFCVSNGRLSDCAQGSCTLCEAGIHRPGQNSNVTVLMNGDVPQLRDTIDRAFAMNGEQCLQTGQSDKPVGKHTHETYELRPSGPLSLSYLCYSDHGHAHHQEGAQQPGPNNAPSPQNHASPPADCLRNLGHLSRPNEAVPQLSSYPVSVFEKSPLAQKRSCEPRHSEATSSSQSASVDGQLVFDETSPWEETEWRNDSTPATSFVSSTGKFSNSGETEDIFLPVTNGFKKEQFEQHPDLKVTTSREIDASRPSDNSTFTGQPISLTESPASLVPPDQNNVRELNGAGETHFDRDRPIGRDSAGSGLPDPLLSPPLRDGSKGPSGLAPLQLSSTFLFHLHQIFEGCVDRYAKFFTSPTVFGGILTPLSDPRPSILLALLALNGIFLGCLPQTNEDVLAICFLVKAIIEEQPEYFESPQRLNEIFLGSLLWIEAISNEEAKCTMKEFVVLLWQSNPLEVLCNQASQGPDSSKPYRPWSTSVLSMEHKAASTNLVQILQQSVLTRICMQCFRGLDRSDLIYRTRHEIMPEALFDQPAGPLFIFTITQCLKNLVIAPIVEHVREQMGLGNIQTPYQLYNHLLQLATENPEVLLSSAQPFQVLLDNELRRIWMIDDLTPSSNEALTKWALQLWEAKLREVPSDEYQEAFDGEPVIASQQAFMASLNPTIPGTPQAVADKYARHEQLPGIQSGFNVSKSQSSDDVTTVQHQAEQPHAREKHRTFSDLTSDRPRILCKRCGRGFSGRDNRSNLKKHIDSVHFRNRYECRWSTCEKHYGRRDNLLKHVREIHMHELMSFACLWISCDQHFADEQSLEKHIHYHTSNAEGKWPEVTLS